MSGIMASSRTSGNGSPVGDRPRAAAQGRVARLDGDGFMPQFLSISSRMRRFVALSSTTRTGRRVQVGGPASPAAGGRGLGLDVEPGGEVERAAPPGLALDPDPPAHQLDQPGRDRQAQPGAAVLAGRRAVGLVERLEDRPLLLGRDADAGVGRR